MDKNIVYNIDCLDLFKTLKNNSVDLAILDPPYNVNAAGWDNIENYLEWMRGILVETQRVLKDDGSLYLWGMTKNNDLVVGLRKILNGTNVKFLIGGKK